MTTDQIFLAGVCIPVKGHREVNCKRSSRGQGPSPSFLAYLNDVLVFLGKEKDKEKDDTRINLRVTAELAGFGVALCTNRDVITNARINGRVTALF